MKAGRKSSASNVVPLDLTGAPSRLTPPGSLNSAERSLFLELISSTDPRHFVRSDLPLLVSFVQATLLSRRTAAKLGAKPNLSQVWERATRVQAMLATRLRLSPQARTAPKTASRRTGRQGSYYDTMELDDGVDGE